MRRLHLLAATVLAVTSCKPSAPGPGAVAAPPAEQQPVPAVPVATPTERTPEQLRRDEQLAARATAVLDSYQNRIAGCTGQLTADGKRLVFGSDRDGSPQLYLGEVARPSARPQPITRGPERVRSAVLTHDGQWVLFTRDRAGDENSHVYRVALDGTGQLDLTPGEGVRYDPPVLPRLQPDVMVLGRRSATSPGSTILVQPISWGPSRVVYQDARPVFVSDVAPDGSRALLTRVISPCETQVLELDLAKGTPRLVWPPEGSRDSVTSATYGADGRTALVATDEGGETSLLIAIDLAADRVKARFTPDPATARIDQVIASPRGDVIAVRIDAGDRSDIRLLDAEGLTEKASPTMPLGTTRLGDVTPDGRWLTLSFSTPERPAEPYALDLDRGSIRALRADARPGSGKPTAVETQLTSVTSLDGMPVPVHVYLPKTRPANKLPVIVYFHGGPAASAHIDWSPWAQYFLGLGYAWVEPNVRGSTGFGRSWEMADNRESRADVLKDMAGVNAWVRAQPWADATRIAIMGGSYGGWVVLMGLTHQPGLWSAGVDLVGVADLRTLLRSTDQSIRSTLADEIGDPDRDDALLASLSPLARAGEITAPLFVYQGQNDPRVPRAQSDSIVTALRARRVPVEYFVAADEGHSLDRRANQVEFLARSARFLEEHMKPGGDASAPGTRSR